MKTRSRSRDWLGNAKSDRSSLVSGVFFASCMRLGGVVGGFGGAAASGEERRKVLQELQRLGFGRFPGIVQQRGEVGSSDDSFRRAGTIKLFTKRKFIAAKPLGFAMVALYGVRRSQFRVG
ncbi:MAG TPA: hypothetical protein VK514_01670 [Candidatus Acidoferrum sp.]|nr:hypothetical protein [Candidatus Acidoferrum sp.]